MPKMSNIAILDQNEQPTISIRTTTKIEDLPMLIGQSYGKIAAYLEELGELPADIPFVAYYNLDMQNLDVEIGFPVTKSLASKDDIEASSIPAGKRIFCMYRGAYSGMAPVYEEMAQWITKSAYQATGTAYEFYYNDPSFPESELLTKIMIPIK
ncbi:MAG: GyrI-like domain-containing protein [Bacillota bacterium]|jgi:effector-binding domain-containing protein